MTTQDGSMPAGQDVTANPKLVAMVTGANSGIGLGIARRLLEYQFKGHSVNDNGQLQTEPQLGEGALLLILACRNESRAQAAKKELMASFPKANIEILLLDTSNVTSITEACTHAQLRFPRITHLFCNAGIMPIEKVNWGGMMRDLVTNPVALFTSADNALQQPVGLKNNEGHGTVFMTNTAGHYLLIRGLEKSLIEGHARVIFTSSHTAKRKYFNLSDIECLQGKFPYQSSKVAMDMLSIALNKRYADQGVKFYLTSPGTVQTPLVPAEASSSATVMSMHMFRSFIPELTIYPDKAVTAAMFLAVSPNQDPAARLKYCSFVTGLGKPYLGIKPIAEMDEFSEEELGSLAQLIEEYCIKLMQEYSSA